MSADAGEKIGDLVRLLEIEQAVGAAFGLLGFQIHLQQHRAKLAADAAMAGRQLQMKALFRIRHTAAGEKSPLDEGLRTAGLLEHAEVDVVRDGPACVAPEAFKNPGDLIRVADAEASFALRILRRELIEGHAESFFEETGKAFGKGREAVMIRTSAARKVLQ